MPHKELCLVPPCCRIPEFRISAITKKSHPTSNANRTLSPNQPRTNQTTSHPNNPSTSRSGTDTIDHTSKMAATATNNPAR